MNKKYSVLSMGIGLSIIATVVIFSGFSDDDIVVLEQDKVPQYIPSNITKANPNIIQGYGSASLGVGDISKVKYKVLYTIRGIVLDVGEPIDWQSSLPTAIYDDGEEYYEIRGDIPVTISVDTVYKGKWNTDEFIFYLDSYKNNNNQYVLLPYSAQFEIGEEVIVHIKEGHPTNTLIEDYFYVGLGSIGKYKVQNEIAYNEHFPLGKAIVQVQQESSE